MVFNDKKAGVVVAEEEEAAEELLIEIMAEKNTRAMEARRRLQVNAVNSNDDADADDDANDV
jgi:hypothetical protein